MRLEVIHLDEGLTGQPAFLAACAEREALVLDAKDEARRIRLWGRDDDLKRVSDRLPGLKSPTLAFLGSGDFHHVSAMLVERAADHTGEPFTVVHFDNHPDWVRRTHGMHCGSWVNRALAISEVAKVITAGVCSKDLQHPEWKGANLNALRSGRLELFAYEQQPSAVSGHYGGGASFHQKGNRIHWSCISDMGIAAFADVLLSRVQTAAIYITLDKDVLVLDDAVTNWDQGKLHLDDIIGLIRLLASNHAVIGADVIGDYSPVQYAGGPWPFVKKWGETLIDHPRVNVDSAVIAARNETANLRLLETFTEVMPRH
jgi:arginase family enzyme